MSSIRFNELIQETIIKWLKAYNGSTKIKQIISEEQRFRASQPLEGDFISYRFSGFRQVGQDETFEDIDAAENITSYYGQRSINVSIVIYAFNSMMIANNLISSLNKNGAIEILSEAKLSWSDDIECKNISALLDCGYEQRASLDINFNTALEYTEESDFIESVEITENIRDAKEIKISQTFTVEKLGD